MITKKVIDEVYRRYRKRPAGTDELDISTLFECAGDNHGISINEREIVIDSIDELSPFHRIELDRIHGIVRFEKTVAIVLHSSIIFLNVDNDGVSVHIKPNPPTFWQKMRWWFSH